MARPPPTLTPFMSCSRWLLRLPDSQLIEANYAAPSHQQFNRHCQHTTVHNNESAYTVSGIVSLTRSVA